jgi:DNA polymerase III subunit gamma/tau
MSTLYRNYRPKKFIDILGQNHIKISLQNEVATNNLSQAYLFSGPRAVGKTTMARVLAKSVNCLNRKEGDYEPCGQCQSCLSIDKSNNLDVIEIDAASNTGVDNVRDNIIAYAQINNSQAGFKVFIVDEVHMLSISAFNALLKIIEEPPAKVIFILCTTELHKVPGTIISRCQRFDFKRIASSEIIKKLQMIVDKEKVIVDIQVLEAVAKESDGHLRDAESLLGQILSLGEKSIDLEKAELVLPRSRSLEAIELLFSLAKKDSGKAIELVNDLVEGGVNLKSFQEELVIMLRKLLLNFAQTGLAEKLGLDFSQEVELKIIELAKTMKPNLALQILNRILISIQEKNYLLPQLPLEMAIFDICLKSENSFIVNKKSQEIEDNKSDNKNTNINEEKSENIKVDNQSINNIDCQTIKERWPEFLMKIKKYNHSLSFILQNCLPGDLKSGKLNLTFKYKFHHDRALDSSVRPIIEKTLSEVFAGQVSIKAILDENLEENNDQKINKEDQKDSKDSSSLLQTFGGQFIS